MAEAGILMAVPSLVAEGIKLSKTLYVFANEVSDARTEARAIAEEVDMTAMSLAEFEESVGAHDTEQLVTPHWHRRTRQCIDFCRATYGDLKDELIKAVPGIDFGTEDTDAPARHAKNLAMRKRDQLKWPFTRTELVAIGKRLDKIKADLHFVTTLMIKAHLYKESKDAADKSARERLAEDNRRRIERDLLRIELRRVALQAELADNAMRNPDNSSRQATSSAGKQRIPLHRPGQNLPAWIFESSSRKSTASLEAMRNSPLPIETKAGASSHSSLTVKQQHITSIASDSMTDQEAPAASRYGAIANTPETESIPPSRQIETKDIVLSDSTAKHGTTMSTQTEVPSDGGMIANQVFHESPAPSINGLGSNHPEEAGDASHVQQEVNATPLSQSETQHPDLPHTPAAPAEDPDVSAGLQEPATANETVISPQTDAPDKAQPTAPKKQPQNSEPSRRRLRDFWKNYQEQHAKKASANDLDPDLQDSRNQFEVRQWRYSIVSEEWEDERLAISRADIIVAVMDFRAKGKSLSKYYARLDHHIQRGIKQRLKEKNENVVEPWTIASITIEPKRARLGDVDAVKIVFWWQGPDHGVDEGGQQRAPRPTHFHPVHLKDAVGRKFSFPWHLANTWDGIHGLICQAFNFIEGVGDHVRDGHYDLTGPNGEIILPSTWADTIRPGWTITMHMWPIAGEEGRTQQETAPREQAGATQPETRVAPVIVPPPPPELFSKSRTKEDRKREIETVDPWAFGGPEKLAKKAKTPVAPALPPPDTIEDDQSLQPSTVRSALRKSSRKRSKGDEYQVVKFKETEAGPGPQKRMAMVRRKSKNTRPRISSDDLRWENLAAHERQQLAEEMEDRRRQEELNEAFADSFQRKQSRQRLSRNIRKEKNQVDKLLQEGVEDPKLLMKIREENKKLMAMMQDSSDPLVDLLQKYTNVQLDDDARQEYPNFEDDADDDRMTEASFRTNRSTVGAALLESRKQADTGKRAGSNRESRKDHDSEGSADGNEQEGADEDPTK